MTGEERLKDRPRFGRYPVPWFVTLKNDKGDPEFRIIDPARQIQAIREKLCWVCGSPLRPKHFAFVIGPMCSVNRVSSDFCMHEECAEYAVLICPFLLDEERTRREHNLEVADDPGMIERNPGVSAIWVAKDFEVIRGMANKILFKLGNPRKVTWWKAGREATLREVEASVNSGLPILQEMADQDPQPGARKYLDKQLMRARYYFPRATL